jgi:hypothetical protein
VNYAGYCYCVCWWKLIKSDTIIIIVITTNCEPIYRPTKNGRTDPLKILVKSKAVPLHAMEGHGGRGGIAPTHS